MISKFFIDRPVFASVISIIIVIGGLLAMRILPISQYPEIRAVAPLPTPSSRQSVSQLLSAYDALRALNKLRGRLTPLQVGMAKTAAKGWDGRCHVPLATGRVTCTAE